MPVQLPSFAPTGGSAPHGKGGALAKVRAKYERGKVSAKSRTGDPVCGAAMSDWKTKGMTPAIAATLGKCRAQAHAKKTGDLHRAAGNDLKADALHHRATKDVVGKGARAAKARELLAARKAKAATSGTATATAPHAGQPMVAKAAAPAPHVTSPVTGHTAAHHRAEAEKHSAIADAHGKTVKHFETFVAKGKAPTAHQRAVYDKAKSKQIMARHEAAHHHGLANAIEAQGKVSAVPHAPTVAAPAPAPAPRDKSAQLDRILGKLQARRDAAETAKRSATDAHIKSKILGKPDAGQHETAKGAAAARLDRLHRHAVTLAGRAGKQNAQTKAVGKRLAAEDRTKDRADSAFGAREAEVRGSMVRAAGLSHTGPVKSAAPTPPAKRKTVAEVMAERAADPAKATAAQADYTARVASHASHKASTAGYAAGTPEHAHAVRINAMTHNDKMTEAKRLGIASPEKHYPGELTAKMVSASVRGDSGHGTAFHGTAGKAQPIGYAKADATHAVSAPTPPPATHPAVEKARATLREQAAAKRASKGGTAERLATIRTKLDAKIADTSAELTRVDKAKHRHTGPWDKYQKLIDRGAVASTRADVLLKRSAKVRALEKTAVPEKFGMVRGAPKRVELASRIRAVRQNIQTQDNKIAKMTYDPHAEAVHRAGLWGEIGQNRSRSGHAKAKAFDRSIEKAKRVVAESGKTGEMRSHLAALRAKAKQLRPIAASPR